MPAPAWSSCRRERSVRDRLLGAGFELGGEHPFGHLDASLPHQRLRDEPVAERDLHREPIDQRPSSSAARSVGVGEHAGLDAVRKIVAICARQRSSRRCAPRAGARRAARASKLHPEDPVLAGDRRVDQRESRSRGSASAASRRRSARRRRPRRTSRLAEQLVARVEPVEDGGWAGPGALGDVRDPGALDAALGDHLGGGSQQLGFRMWSICGRGLMPGGSPPAGPEASASNPTGGSS